MEGKTGQSRCISRVFSACAAIFSRLFPLLLSALLLSGCGHGTPVCPYPPRPARHGRFHRRARTRPPLPSKVILPRVAYFDAPRTIFHQVGPGESIPRICRMYGLLPQTVRRENGLGQKGALRTGQVLILRDVKTIRYVLNLYRTRPWSYIIVHHTATDAGDAGTIERAHLQRGFWNGIGYDFVIDNGTMGKGDGVIEMSPRWLRQEDGAHCKADDMNRRGIGISLVGNFDVEKPSRYQLQSLAYLIYILRHYYHIPPSHIMGHGQVPGARTDCPGKLFPMDFLKWAAQR
ncbi:MAG: N-acetylmuramoyl-L-alanine amidase [Syntrophobacteraceae bacterium]|nr:N-acetylmuramoyl-L-alanine amidase [Syntrophobacteraceae bacterium]